MEELKILKEISSKKEKEGKNIFLLGEVKRTCKNLYIEEGKGTKTIFQFAVSHLINCYICLNKRKSYFTRLKIPISSNRTFPTFIDHKIPIKLLNKNEK